MLGSRQPPIVGAPEQVADELIAWVDEGDVDGFNLARTVAPECLDAFIELVVPVLQERGMFKREYAAGSYRHKLFGLGDRLPTVHLSRFAGEVETRSVGEVHELRDR